MLAVCPLNAGQKMIQNGMKNLVSPMSDTLMNPALVGDFADAGPDTLSAVADMFGILDNYPMPQVGKTNLMKVLHRKRSNLIPSFDANRRRCYSERGSRPVPGVNDRCHRDFAVAWLPFLQRDLREQQEFWDEISAWPIPWFRLLLRAIDIVGWLMGRRDR